MPGFGILWNSAGAWSVEVHVLPLPAAGNWSFLGAVPCPGRKSHPSYIPESCGM